MKKVLFLLFTFSVCGRLDTTAQTADYPNWIFGASAGWQYQKGNFMKVSGWGLFAPNNEHYIKVEAGTNLSWMQKRTTVIPELGITYYLGDRLIFPYLKAEVTPYTLTPKIGISVLSLFDIGVGYGFDVKSKSSIGVLNGITTSLNINIPFNYHLK